MLKKIMLVGMAALTVGCSFSGKSVQQEAFPGEFANADYVLSDKDAQRWVALSEQASQCIYPNLTRIQQAHFSKEDAYIHSQYVFFYPLEEVIGEQYVKIVQGDEKSMGYAQYQFKKFKNTPADVDKMSNKQCQTLRAQAKDDLAVVKGQYKSGMVEEVQTETKSGDSVATNDNKFFFDIIKWGSALLL
ncbi:hypothetical protein HMPREF0027_0298 [Actinobacillus ureae ATCC 25976]|uniref:Bifunctional riboflavin kinase/FMN adenylyltransferase n=1 Tax=Actinobacillus ureae ATCC 25976 TaxID=887324 RepID=E8KEN1_9PAST|nr:DUF5358 domain-containing protein [Actinobacillus ureae]EFX92660.1 hypothetical protein HMPREF0027_0298 [Actinobacillus ureae ATCC 25976]